MAETAPTFGQPFLRRLVAALLRDRVLATRVAALLQPKWLEDEVLADVADVAIEHIKKYRAVPTKLVFREECGRDLVNSAAFKKLYTLPKGDIPYAVDKLTEFCRMSAMREAIILSAKELEGGNPDRIVARVQDALKVGLDLTELGTRLSDWKSRIPYYLEGDDLTGVVATGWEHVDQILGGGVGPGELMVMLGCTGGGKSHSLVNIGLAAAMNGKKVVHYTFEMKDKKLLKRYDKRYVSKHAHLLAAAPEQFIKKLARQHRILSIEGDVVVHYAPTRSFSPNMMRAHLDALYSSWDYKPDLVIVDYGDIMKADRRIGETRHEQAGIFEDLRGIAGEYDVPVVTASQANRAATEKKVIRKTDIGESYEKAQIADVILALCQTPEEKEEGEMRLFFAKVRDAADEKTVSAYVDFSASIIRTTGINVPVPVDREKKNVSEFDADRVSKMNAAASKRPGRKLKKG